MKIFLWIVGMACIAYALVEKKRKRDFKSVMDDSEAHAADWAEPSLAEENFFKDSLEMGRAIRQMESDLRAMQNVDKALQNRVGAVENLLKNFKSPEKAREPFMPPKALLEKLHAGDQSLEDLAAETGMEKGELLFLKRFYQR